MSTNLQFADQQYVDTLDSMDIVPRRGKFFAELVVAGTETSGGVVMPGASEEEIEESVAPRRAKVTQLGKPPLDENGNEIPWDLEVGWHVVVAYHAGHRFQWQPLPGVTEDRWIIDYREPIAIFKPRKENES